MAIYCPQCGTEAHSKQQFCRQCGVNLALIGKALSLSETIARGDKGPMPRVKEIVANLKVEDIGEEIGRGIDQMTREIERSFDKDNRRQRGEWRPTKRTSELTPVETYAQTVRDGATSLFGGIGMTIALFVILPKIVIQIPPDQLARFPFEVGAAVQMAWVLGLIPLLSGIGKLIGARMTRPALLGVEAPQVEPVPERAELPPPVSVTEHTTAFLDEEPATPPERRVRTTG